MAVPYNHIQLSRKQIRIGMWRAFPSAPLFLPISLSFSYPPLPSLSLLSSLSSIPPTHRGSGWSPADKRFLVNFEVKIKHLSTTFLFRFSVINVEIDYMEF